MRQTWRITRLSANQASLGAAGTAVVAATIIPTADIVVGAAIATLIAARGRPRNVHVNHPHHGDLDVELSEDVIDPRKYYLVVPAQPHQRLTLLLRQSRRSDSGRFRPQLQPFASSAITRALSVPRSLPI